MYLKVMSLQVWSIWGIYYLSILSRSFWNLWESIDWSALATFKWRLLKSLRKDEWNLVVGMGTRVVLVEWTILLPTNKWNYVSRSLARPQEALMVLWMEQSPAAVHLWPQIKNQPFQILATTNQVTRSICHLQLSIRTSQIRHSKSFG